MTRHYSADVSGKLPFFRMQQSTMFARGVKETNQQQIDFCKAYSRFTGGTVAFLTTFLFNLVAGYTIVVVFTK